MHTSPSQVAAFLDCVESGASAATCTAGGEMPKTAALLKGVPPAERVPWLRPSPALLLVGLALMGGAVGSVVGRRPLARGGGEALH
jgi:hypothetical protein